MGNSNRHFGTVHHGSLRYRRLLNELEADAGGVLLIQANPAAARATANVLATDLGLSLYRIDLAAIISKYIGETEKNLRQLFEQAEERDWTLFFDEADALFGRRTEVSKSHQKFLKLLLSHPRLSILTADVKGGELRAYRGVLRAVLRPER